jgi:metal-responsive CopG/Arc/MetJ family transcriptional regulator
MTDVVNRIIIQLDDLLMEALDRAAAQDGVARSRFIREALRRALFEKRRQAELQQVVDSYTALPPQDDEFFPQSPKAWPE